MGSEGSWGGRESCWNYSIRFPADSHSLTLLLLEFPSLALCSGSNVSSIKWSFIHQQLRCTGLNPWALWSATSQCSELCFCVSASDPLTATVHHSCSIRLCTYFDTRVRKISPVPHRQAEKEQNFVSCLALYCIFFFLLSCQVLSVCEHAQGC